MQGVPLDSRVALPGPLEDHARIDPFPRPEPRAALSVEARCSSPSARCSNRDAPAPQSASAASSPALAAVRDDPYDSAKMDYKSSAAALSGERHTGAFASGDVAQHARPLAPLDPSPVKEVRLDTTHKIIEIAPGVRFSAWTFGDTVPGPGDPCPRRRPHQVQHDQPLRRDCTGHPADGRAHDALDGFPLGHGVAAGQVPLDRARADDLVRVHAELRRRLHVPLRHANGARAHRVRHVRDDDRRAPRRLSDQGRSRVRGSAERVLYQARPGQAQGRRSAAPRPRR